MNGVEISINVLILQGSTWFMVPTFKMLYTQFTRCGKPERKPPATPSMAKHIPSSLHPTSNQQPITSTMKDSFDNIVQKTNEFNMLLEDVMNILPDTSKNYKLKKKIEAAYKNLKRSLERHEDLITDSVPPITRKMDYPPEFIEAWNIYKDYLIEQFGIRMRSRMEKFRLKLLYDLSEKDLTKATRWIEYYMAAGSSNIYPVNDFEIQKKEDDKQKTTAGFVLPGKAN